MARPAQQANNYVTFLTYTVSTADILSLALAHSPASPPDRQACVHITYAGKEQTITCWFSDANDASAFFNALNAALGL